MTPKLLAAALSMIVIISPASAQPDSGAIETDLESPVTTTAPPGTPGTKYCMRVVLTGHVMEPVRCWTREHWAEQGVDVDRDWADEGVRVIEA
jgi:hypothetical protein